jgi:hypothetical protein
MAPSSAPDRVNLELGEYVEALAASGDHEAVSDLIEGLSWATSPSAVRVGESFPGVDGRAEMLRGLSRAVARVRRDRGARGRAIAEGP